MILNLECDKTETSETPWLVMTRNWVLRFANAAIESQGRLRPRLRASEAQSANQTQPLTVTCSVLLCHTVSLSLPLSISSWVSGSQHLRKRLRLSGWVSLRLSATSTSSKRVDVGSQRRQRRVSEAEWVSGSQRRQRRVSEAEWVSGSQRRQRRVSELPRTVARCDDAVRCTAIRAKYVSYYQSTTRY